MDAKSLIDQLLVNGKQFAEKGRGVAEEKLNIPEGGAERDAMLSGMGKGALAAGALAILLGTKGGRSITGGALKLGGLAAIGGLAYKTYKDWQAGNGNDDTNSAFEEVELETVSEDHGRLILSAMIAAAKADGHIDDNERTGLQNYIDRIGESPELSAYVERELSKPLDPGDIASKVSSQEVAAEVYLASLLIIDQENFMAKSYLEGLARALALPPELVASLNQKVDPAV
ncbi:MAG: tellurite resistance TerB family protein [Acidiferrobacterales bacterium]|nr:tellurite resistance TerB family protein [Acidiferrobacterales bacterium]